jgi:DNA excision repair protein ERCC-3
MVILATRGTTEEDFVRRQMRHLASKGIQVTETESDAVETPDDDEE